ncbi:MAG TPA: SRPBCC family protein [Thermodesulfobacteriota bacterium]|nr:SRPBCC family protein [Thermodesulfobacteriota bacterium]
MLRSLVFGMILSLVTIGTSYSAVQNSAIGGQVFKGSVEINASAEKVWAVLTDLKTFTPAIGFEFLSGKEKVDAVGDTARIKVWSDNTTYLLTYADVNNELRFALEPDNASYICQKRWLLESNGKKTKLTLIDIYTESGKQSQESLDKQVADWEKKLAKLKELAEAS